MKASDIHSCLRFIRGHGREATESKITDKSTLLVSRHILLLDLIVVVMTHSHDHLIIEESFHFHQDFHDSSDQNKVLPNLLNRIFVFIRVTIAIVVENVVDLVFDDGTTHRSGIFPNVY